MASYPPPTIISPNLGCPCIASVEEIFEGTSRAIPLVIATGFGDLSTAPDFTLPGKLLLRPSFSEDGDPGPISLEIRDSPIEIIDWHSLPSFSEAHDTRLLINRVLHYDVLGKEHRYWRVDAFVEEGLNEAERLLRTRGGRLLPALYDLVLTASDGNSEKVNAHAVQFVPTFNEGCTFIHLTDLHVATRNDEILDEVVLSGNRRPRKEIENSYVNFNENFRKFIHDANKMADNGELDFIVITGDLVDFAFHGWEDAPNDAENNWRTFVNILTGRGVREKSRGNPGVKVATFTSTGNHDWRPRPYNPNLKGIRERFGLTSRELDNYGYTSFDPERYAHKRARLEKEIIRERVNVFNIDAFTDKYLIKLSQLVSHETTQSLLPIIAGALGVSGARAAGVAVRASNLVKLGAYGFVGAALLGGTKSLVDWVVDKRVKLLLDNPLYASQMALHYYLKYVNPFLDYAFSWGKHLFVAMDTGPDAFAGSFMDEKDTDSLKRLSFVGSILGGSPDSRAFDSQRSHSSWSQIVWLEKVLSSLNKSDEQPGWSVDEGRTFVFLHTPPVNTRYGVTFVRDKLWESRRQDKPVSWIPRREHPLTFGTINHYVSQFLYLALGSKEGASPEDERAAGLKKVDLVLSGHTHRNLEFRIEKTQSHAIRVYADPYSDRHQTAVGEGSATAWWAKHSPLLVQTAACGFRGKSDPHPPYFRKIAIDRKGTVKEFSVYNRQGRVSLEKPEDDPAEKPALTTI